MYTVGDAQIDDLLLTVSLLSAQLADRMAEMATTQEAAVRRQMRAEVSQLTQELRLAIQAWLTNVFGEMVQEMDEDILADMPADLLDEYGEALPFNPADLSVAIETFQQDMGRAVLAIEEMASRLQSGDLAPAVGSDGRSLIFALGVGAAGSATVASIRAAASHRLRERLLHLVGADGRIYQYDLAYYAGLSAHSLKMRSYRDLLLGKAGRLGADLVQISKNPSTIGDYCDAFRGKVFSLSGGHPVYPPLAQAPSGGAPFHPWCHHRMKVFSDRGVSAAEARRLADIPEALLELGKVQASPNEYQRVWRRLKRKGRRRGN